MHDASHITFRGLDRKLTLAHHDTIKYLSKTLYGCISYGRISICVYECVQYEKKKI